jgi:hypothetical protein
MAGGVGGAASPLPAVGAGADWAGVGVACGPTEGEEEGVLELGWGRWRGEEVAEEEGGPR